MGYYVYNERQKRRAWRPLASFVVAALFCGSLTGFFARGLWIKNHPPQISITKPTLLSPLKTEHAPQPKQAVVAGARTQTSSETPTAYINELLTLTNQQRAKLGRANLLLNAQLSSSAAAKCADMAQGNYWSHVDLTGREPWHFIDESGYRKQAAAENLAYGFTSAQAVVAGWMNSPEHREALLSSTYQDVGFGVCVSPNYISQGEQTIVVQHFGLQLP